MRSPGREGLQARLTGRRKTVPSKERHREIGGMGLSGKLVRVWERAFTRETSRYSQGQLLDSRGGIRRMSRRENEGGDGYTEGANGERRRSFG